MSLAKRYDPQEAEPALMQRWQDESAFQFDQNAPGEVYSIDSPPATVSGNLHLGHIYSYSHPDFMARYFRMRGRNVFYPMGFDDNGLPTERLIEKRLNIKAREMGRSAFIETCLRESEAAEVEYQKLWQRLGLSIDWRFTYRTIDHLSRQTSQLSFVELYKKGLAYRAQAPAIWCPECQTSIAQAELNDLERESEFVTLPFALEGGVILPIATTRPELLAACVAVFVHPQDTRYRGLVGKTVITPFYHRPVPVMADPLADPTKGTGAVMCCTFGDQTDVAWWSAHKLPLIQAIDREGRMTALTGAIAGLPIEAARSQIKALLAAQNLILARERTAQSIRVHERCDTPAEYLLVYQWFIRILQDKETFLKLGAQIRWHPDYMQARYQAWVENLNWDWCISRQRYYGVPIPAWYCKACGEVIVAEASDLPADPLAQPPPHPCPCGSTEFEPERDVMDTWATSSMTPQIVCRWLEDPRLYARLFPMTMRPQGHEIIRTWAFYTIVKSHDLFGALPWSDVLISGWGLAGEGQGKISKSRGGGPMPPIEMIRRYSADAVRYWAASTSTGRDAVISEEKIQSGAKLATKLWNAARFAEPFIAGRLPQPQPEQLTPADRWIMARTQQVIRAATAGFEAYDYSAAKNEVEAFFWRDLADNYFEMAKQRLYDASHPQHLGARTALKTALSAVLKLLAPIMPFVTEAIFLDLFAQEEAVPSIHRSRWPEEATGPALTGADGRIGASIGDVLIAIASSVRRYKSEQSLSLGTKIQKLGIRAQDPALEEQLRASAPDLESITRAECIVTGEPEPGATPLESEREDIRLWIIR